MIKNGLGPALCHTWLWRDSRVYTGRASALKVTTFWRERKELNKQADN